MKYLKIKYRLLVYLTSFTVCFGNIKKKSSENDQLTGHFQNVSLLVPPTLNLKKIPINQLIKKIQPKQDTLSSSQY